MNNLEPKKEKILTSEDIEKGKALMEQFKELKKQLEEKLSKIQARAGLSIKEFKAFFELKSNFSEKKWDNFQKQKEAFDNALKQFKSVKLVKEAKNKKIKPKKLGNRARQRPNWLSM